MSFYLRASPVSERPRRGRRAGPFPAGRLPPPPKSPGKERLALPFSVGPRQCPGAPTPKFGLRWVVGWSCSVRAVEQLQAMRSQPAAAAGARGRGAPRLPGSRARPRTLFSFSGLFVPLSVFCHPPGKGKPNKRVSLFLFRACKVEDI